MRRRRKKTAPALGVPILPAKDAVCFLCGGPTPKEDYCNGCGQIVCASCDTSMPWGTHEPEDHHGES